MTIREQVTEFHKAMGVPIADNPTVPDAERVRLRLRLIAEEFGEFCEAIGYPIDLPDFDASWNGSMSIVDLADALADLDYVIEGTRLEFGINGEPIAAEVHRSNMAKLDRNGRAVVREDGKILKPLTWTPPDIAGELRKQGWEP
jgi:predicted HAD superfamily Cof-like phosphohydrolase